MTLSTEKKHNLKVENYVLFSKQSEDISPGHSLSDHSDRLPEKGQEGARIYRSVYNKDQIV